MAAVTPAPLPTLRHPLLGLPFQLFVRLDATQTDQAALVHSTAHPKEPLGDKNGQLGQLKPGVLPEGTSVTFSHSSVLE